MDKSRQETQHSAKQVPATENSTAPTTGWKPNIRNRKKNFIGRGTIFPNTNKSV